MLMRQTRNSCRMKCIRTVGWKAHVGHTWRYVASDALFTIRIYVELAAPVAHIGRYRIGTYLNEAHPIRFCTEINSFPASFSVLQRFERFALRRCVCALAVWLYGVELPEHLVVSQCSGAQERLCMVAVKDCCSWPWMVFIAAAASCFSLAILALVPTKNTVHFVIFSFLHLFCLFFSTALPAS